MSDRQIDSLRFMRLLNIVYKEGGYLIQTDQRLFKSVIDAGWVSGLENNQNAAEQLDAFSARSGAPCYLTTFWDSCHQHSFAYAANGRCPGRPASVSTTHKTLLR
ncbi:hypothetical protein bplSymb_SCF06001P002 [Bathymodiolus platifrons methanotrophic gill symbiont]|uniref:hypothetical protein n=1 Tax=Bathymodiolus platifrons methanotrophic gill symbiont TaxID=113268 RepID=UPI000B41AFE5|nr:hypothetical protein [Bathymodiolus platifrons methanotrophic gill symbiont]GAW87152.1 hypothetical protein bplSymb_SCF06001P002 [Bathymodiolus platifrons methanotrophic gill symbiont]